MSPRDLETDSNPATECSGVAGSHQTPATLWSLDAFRDRAITARGYTIRLIDWRQRIPATAGTPGSFVLRVGQFLRRPTLPAPSCCGPRDILDYENGYARPEAIHGRAGSATPGIPHRRRGLALTRSLVADPCLAAGADTTGAPAARRVS